MTEDQSVQSEQNSNQDSSGGRVEALKATYAHLAFIHQKFITTQFFLEEMAQADASMKFITEMANKVADEINTLTPKQEVKEESINVEA